MGKESFLGKLIKLTEREIGFCAGIVKDATFDIFDYSGLHRAVIWRDIGIAAGVAAFYTGVILTNIRLEDPTSENFEPTMSKNLNFDITGVCNPSHEGRIKLHRDLFISETSREKLRQPIEISVTNSRGESQILLRIERGQKFPAYQQLHTEDRFVFDSPIRVIPIGIAEDDLKPRNYPDKTFNSCR